MTDALLDAVQRTCDPATRRGKNTALLHLAADVCLLLGGGRVTMCKSAKDRSSMAVTLEQASVITLRAGRALLTPAHAPRSRGGCGSSTGCPWRRRRQLRA